VAPDSSSASNAPRVSAAVEPAPRAVRSGSRTRRLLGSGARALPSVAVLVLLVIVWQLVVSVFDISPITLPPPADVARYLADNPGPLWLDTLATIKKTLIAFALSMVVGIPLGVLTHRSTLFRRTVYPLLVGSQAFPKLALGPLFIVWFGFGTLPIILLAVLLIFFPITLNTILGLEAVQTETRELARMLGLRWYQNLWRIQVPQALPSVFAGLRIASALAVVGVVVGEFLGTNEGLGYRIVNSTATADTLSLFASLIILAVFGAVFYALIAVAEAVSIPWHKPRPTAQ